MASLSPTQLLQQREAERKMAPLSPAQLRRQQAELREMAMHEQKRARWNQQEQEKEKQRSAKLEAGRQQQLRKEEIQRQGLKIQADIQNQLKNQRVQQPPPRQPAPQPVQQPAAFRGAGGGGQAPTGVVISPQEQARYAAQMQAIEQARQESVRQEQARQATQPAPPPTMPGRPYGGAQVPETLEEKNQRLRTQTEGTGGTVEGGGFAGPTQPYTRPGATPFPTMPSRPGVAPLPTRPLPPGMPSLPNPVRDMPFIHYEPGKGPIPQGTAPGAAPGATFTRDLPLVSRPPGSPGMAPGAAPGMGSGMPLGTAPPGGQAGDLAAAIRATGVQGDTFQGRPVPSNINPMGALRTISGGTPGMAPGATPGAPAFAKGGSVRTGRSAMPSSQSKAASKSKGMPAKAPKPARYARGGSVRGAGCEVRGLKKATIY